MISGWLDCRELGLGNSPEGELVLVVLDDQGGLQVVAFRKLDGSVDHTISD